MFGQVLHKKIIALLALLISVPYTLQDTATSAHATTHTTCATIIFDMGGVLVETNPSAASKEIGIKYFVNYMMTFNSPRKAREILFKFLGALKPRDPKTPQAKHGDLLLPQLMCDWISGTCSWQKLTHTVRAGIADNVYPFKNVAEQKMIQAIAEFMFNPTKHIKPIRLLKQGVELVRACAAARDAIGNRACRLMIVSNWDAQSFELLKQKPEFQELFALFDDIVVSGAVHKIKPDPTIFTDLFTKHNIDPDNHLCILIDDQPENICAFEQCGQRTKGILCKKFKRVRAELEQLLDIDHALIPATN